MSVLIGTELSLVAILHWCVCVFEDPGYAFFDEEGRRGASDA